MSSRCCTEETKARTQPLPEQPTVVKANVNLKLQISNLSYVQHPTSLRSPFPSTDADTPPSTKWLSCVGALIQNTRFVYAFSRNTLTSQTVSHTHKLYREPYRYNDGLVKQNIWIMSRREPPRISSLGIFGYVCPVYNCGKDRAGLIRTLSSVHTTRVHGEDDPWTRASFFDTRVHGQWPTKPVNTSVKNDAHVHGSCWSPVW